MALGIEMIPKMMGIKITKEQKESMEELMNILEENQNQLKYLITHAKEICDALIFFKSYMKELKKHGK